MLLACRLSKTRGVWLLTRTTTSIRNRVECKQIDEKLPFQRQHPQTLETVWMWRLFPAILVAICQHHTFVISDQTESWWSTNFRRSSFSLKEETCLPALQTKSSLNAIIQIKFIKIYKMVWKRFALMSKNWMSLWDDVSLTPFIMKPLVLCLSLHARNASIIISTRTHVYVCVYISQSTCVFFIIVVIYFPLIRMTNLFLGA